MGLRNINLSLLVEETSTPHPGALSYALDLCEQASAHLTLRIGVPLVAIPGAAELRLVRAMVDEVNAERLAAAREVESQATVQARLAGAALDSLVLQKSLRDLRQAMVATARLADLIVVSRGEMSIDAENALIETMLFESGRPVIVVPHGWSDKARFGKIVVAWDGGARAARALGDAMTFIDSADEVEVVCVSAAAAKSMEGADIADHLARHCRKVALTELQVEFGDAGRVLEDHIGTTGPDLLVMGAFGHSRFLQFILGGVTRTMLDRAKIPVLYSF